MSVASSAVDRLLSAPLTAWTSSEALVVLAGDGNHRRRRHRLWARLGRATDDEIRALTTMEAEDGSGCLAVDALNAALASWPTTARALPDRAWAETRETPATGPHDPGEFIFVGVKATPEWPTPLARHLGLGDLNASHLPALIRSGVLQHIAGLGIPDHFDDDDLASLFAATPELHTVLLGCGYDPVRRGRSLIALPQTVRDLTIHRGGDVDGLVVRQLTARRKVERLSLHGIDLRPLGDDALLQLAIPGRRRLRLHGSAVNDAMIAALGHRREHGLDRGFEQLDVEDAGLGGPPLLHNGVALLAEGGWLDGVTRLRLGFHACHGTVWQRVLDAADLSQLRVLELWTVPFTDDDAAVLLADDVAARFPALTGVSIQYSQLSGETEQALRTRFPD